MKKTSRPAVQVIVVEQDDLYRDLLRVALDQHSGVELVGTFASGADALARLQVLRPQVAVIDVDLDGQNGIQVAMKLQRQLPDLGVVLLANPRDSVFLTSIPNNLLLGWSYLLNKSTHGLTALVRAIQITHARLLNLGEMEEVGLPRHSGAQLPELTRRQLEILELVVQGLTNLAIAQTLQLKEKTVENQLAAIYGKFQVDVDRARVHPRVWAALYYQRSTRSERNRPAPL